MNQIPNVARPLKQHIRMLTTMLVLLAAGCGGRQPSPVPPPTSACAPASPAEFAYSLSNATISMFTVNSCTGAFMPTSPATIPAGTSSGQIPAEDMVVDPKGRFLYVANLVSNAVDAATISMFTINPSTGVLTPTTPATIPTGFFPQEIGIDPAGKFVYTANSDDNTISMFAIDPDTGLLTATTPPVVNAGSSPLAIAIHPSGSFAYVANQDDGSISMYTINSSTGVLSPTTPATVRGGNFGVTVDPSGKFVYSVENDTNSVSQFTIDQITGKLLPNTPTAVSVGNGPTAVAVDPTSKFAYVVNRGDDTLSMFTIEPNTGNLSPNGVILTGNEPFRILFDPSGKFLYVVNENDPAFIFTVNSDGKLTAAGETGGPSLAIALTSVSHQPGL